MATLCLNKDSKPSSWPGCDRFVMQASCGVFACDCFHFTLQWFWTNMTTSFSLLCYSVVAWIHLVLICLWLKSIAAGIAAGAITLFSPAWSSFVNSWRLYLSKGLSGCSQRSAGVCPGWTLFCGPVLSDLHGGLHILTGSEVNPSASLTDTWESGVHYEIKLWLLPSKQVWKCLKLDYLCSRPWKEVSDKTTAVFVVLSCCLLLAAFKLKIHWIDFLPGNYY